MDGPERRRRKDYQNAVEYLCANLTELTETADGTRWPRALEPLATAVPFTEAWYAAVRELHEIAEDSGILGGLGLTNPMGWPGGDGGERRIVGWGCPDRACTRVESADSQSVGGTPPRCHLRPWLPMRHVEV